MFEEMEDQEKGKKLVRTKARIEVIYMQLVKWMRLEEASSDPSSPRDNINSMDPATPQINKKRRDVPALYCPDTGSRLLMNASNEGEEHIPHIDFVLRKIQNWTLEKIL